MIAKNTEFVVFDVETTGLSPLSGDKIIELAALKVKNNEVVDQFDTLVNPLREIPIEAQRINNITPDMVVDSPTADQVLPDFVNFIGGSCLVAHNIKFDLDFVCYELSQIGRKMNDRTPAIDTLKLAKKFVPHLTSHRLASLAQTFGVRIDETHRALADVQLTVPVLYRLLDIATDKGMSTFTDVLKECGVTKPNFKIQEVNQGFLF